VIVLVACAVGIWAFLFGWLMGWRDANRMGDRFDELFWSASGTEARRAETGTGSVHDGPVAESETPTPSPRHPPEGE